MHYIVETDRRYSIKQTWYKTVEAYIAHYQLKLDEHLMNKDTNCTRDKHEINMFYAQYFDVCSFVSDSIPITCSQSHHSNHVTICN